MFARKTPTELGRQAYLDGRGDDVCPYYMGDKRRGDFWRGFYGEKYGTADLPDAPRLTVNLKNRIAGKAECGLRKGT